MALVDGGRLRLGVPAGAPRGSAGAATPAPARGPAHLLCPNLRIGPPHDLYVDSDGSGGRRALLRATSDVRSRGRGPMELRGRRDGPALDAGQPAHLQGRRRPHRRPHRATAALHRRRRLLRRPYWKVHELARFELWSLGDHRRHAAPASASARSSTTACATSSGPGPGGARPTTATTPAATRTPTRTGVTLGTSVGWSDIYPADYDKQWIDVTGLRGCFAFVMTVDPQHLLFESERARQHLVGACVRLPYTRATRGC